MWSPRGQPEEDRKGKSSHRVQALAFSILTVARRNKRKVWKREKGKKKKIIVIFYSSTYFFSESHPLCFFVGLFYTGQSMHGLVVCYFNLHVELCTLSKPLKVSQPPPLKKDLFFILRVWAFAPCVFSAFGGQRDYRVL